MAGWLFRWATLELAPRLTLQTATLLARTCESSSRACAHLWRRKLSGVMAPRIAEATQALCTIRELSTYLARGDKRKYLKDMAADAVKCARSKDLAGGYGIVRVLAGKAATSETSEVYAADGRLISDPH